MVIYFAKINLNSKHIYDVHSGKLKLTEVLDIVLSTFESGTEFIQQIMTKDGLEVNVEQIKYKLHILSKEDDYIRGRIYKNSKMRYKVFEDDSEELKTKTIKNTEVVDFYFDVYNEMVGYNTALHLGHREFLDAFSGLLNMCLQKDKNQYEFTVDLYSEGLDIVEIEEQLKEIYNIQFLKFKFQPPNVDNTLLESLEDNADNTIKDFKEANIATKSVIFKASKIAGLNIQSKEIKEQIWEINNLHSSINSNIATQNGYVEVEAIDSHGNKHTTSDKKPVKKEISDIIYFEDACKSIIRNHRPKKE